MSVKMTKTKIYWNRKVVKSLIKKGVDVNCEGEGGDTPLIAAAGQGHIDIVKLLIDKGVDVRETHDVADVIENADVLYVTRVQKERFSDLAQYEEVKDHYEITPELMERAKEKMIIMHPLPRVGEIHYAVDSDPRAAYFRQVKNGMYIRMALLAAVLGEA